MHAYLSEMTLIGIAVILAFYMGKLVKKISLPSIIGYIVVGAIIGPSIIGLFDEKTVKDFNFISNIALGFVAFSIGIELKFSTLKKLGYGIITIIFAESLFAFVVVFIGIYLLTRDLPLSLVFAAMAPASAPAGTVAVIQECRARGDLTKALYAVVGFDDGLAIIIFGFAASLAKILLEAEQTGVARSLWPSLINPSLEIFFTLILGFAVGLLFCQLIRFLDTSRDMFILIFGSILITTGLAITFHLSYILANMVIGIMFVNTRSEAFVHKAAAPLMDFMPFIFVLFFCLAGLHLDISKLPALGVIGIVYILTRSAGKIAGASLGAVIGSIGGNIRKYLGIGILSQAGVAIGLSLIVSSEFAKFESQHARYIGISVITTITATSIVFEIIGPILTKFALQISGEIRESE